MEPQTASDRQYPAQWAFVVQFGRRSDVTRGQLTGRVEHVVSGEASHFQAAEELLAFFGRLLTQQDSEAPAEP